MPPHLTDEALNEYLDAALAPAERAAAAAHLAACQPCTARLDTLRALFADLEALPAVPLARDLAPAVLRALPTATPMRNSVPARRPAIPWLVLGEAFAAVLLLALAWPLIGALFTAANLTSVAAEWLARLPALTPAAWLADAQQAWAALFPAPNVTFDLPPLTIGLAVAGAAALWLVGNGLLLRRSVTILLRRRA